MHAWAKVLVWLVFRGVWLQSLTDKGVLVDGLAVKIFFLLFLF